jgi:hypothetical protein
MKLWRLWIGPEPESIKLFDDLALRHYPDAHILRGDGWREHAGRHHELRFRLGLALNHQADVIRYILLCRNGGIWLDSDCIVMQDLEPMTLYTAEYDMILYEERYNDLGEPDPNPEYCDNNFIVAKANTGPIRMARDRSLEMTKDHDLKMDHTAMAQPLMRDVYKAYPDRVGVLDWQLFMPIHWSQGVPAGAWFKPGTDIEHEQRFCPGAYTYMLSRGVIHHTRNWSRRRWLKGSEFICYLVRKAWRR